jgi:hypothetical protein
MFPKDQTNLSAYTVDLFNLAPSWLERCQSINTFAASYLNTQGH